MSIVRKYKKPEDLADVIDTYFAETPCEQWTVTGLALAVGSKQLLYDYEKRDGYKQLVNAAQLMVENAYEIALRTTGGAGNIFALKNFGWKDKQEIEQNIKYSDMSEQDLDAKLKMLLEK